MVAQDEAAALQAPARVAAILREFAEAATAYEGRDVRLWQALDLLLTELGADAVVFRPTRTGSPLAVFKDYLHLTRPSKAALTKRIDALAREERFDLVSAQFFVDTQTDNEIVFCFPEFSGSNKDTGREYFAFIKGSSSPPAQGEKRWAQITGHAKHSSLLSSPALEVFETYCRVIQLAFSRRAEADSVLPVHLSEIFWNAVDDDEATANFLRPWETASGVAHRKHLTATLSFDIRKSTFAMEQAIDSHDYARWIEGLVILLRRIAHDQCGVFDKFTGDGVLVHFPLVSLALHSHAEQNKSGLAAASLTCAWEMMAAFEEYLEFLLPNLALQRTGLGAAVGIALDHATWSADRMGAPIVVGRGVVHACRASGGPAGVVQVTNGLYQAASQLYASSANWQEVDFVTKEFPEGSEVKLMRCVRPLDRLGRSREVLWGIANEVYREINASVTNMN